MKLTKEVLVRIIQQELKAMNEEEADLEKAIAAKQAEKTDQLNNQVGGLVTKMAADVAKQAKAAGAKLKDFDESEVIEYIKLALPSVIKQQMDKMT
tara:strand:+ start:187 stop:474 length:288 start_codon:yes stop_codon:yes gene_type:complete